MRGRKREKGEAIIEDGDIGDLLSDALEGGDVERAGLTLGAP